MHRRRLIETGFVAVVLAALPARAQASSSLVFEVRRNGSPIGYHRLEFDQQGSDLQVTIEIELTVKLAFITLYRHRHSNIELWRDGAFFSFASETDDNGERLTAAAKREGDVIVVEGRAGRIEVPSDLLPTTYWHRDFMRQNRWIDTMYGKLVEADVADLGTASLGTARSSIKANQYRLRGDLDMDLWYRDEQWVGLSFEGPDGSTIDYRLEEDPVHRVSLKGDR